MKRLLLIAAFLTSNCILFAQAPVGAPAAAKAGQAIPNIGHVFGKLVDSAGKSISDASVLILRSTTDPSTKKVKEVLLKGTSTQGNGDFSIEELPVMGALVLKISATGYKPTTQTISFMPAGGKPSGAPAAPPAGAGSMGMPSFEKDLGSLRLASEIVTLQTVTVTATKGMIMDIDKKVFNVDKNLVSAGGTALDVMKNVPSINVDIDGNVSLRNSSPQIFVDGRPTTLTLEQIPADAIENVEVITNPSAKYDASGGGSGILNIVLKKNKKTGYNGNLRTGIDKRGAINAGADFNVRQGKINFFANVNVSQMKGVTLGNTDRLNFVDAPQTFIIQTNYNKTKGAFVFGRAGLDYFISNRTTLSFAGFKVHGEFNPYENINITTDSMYTASTIKSFSNRFSTGNRQFNGQGLSGGLKYNFPKEGKELTADVSYFGGKNENNSLYTTNQFVDAEGTQVRGTQLQKIMGSGNDYNIVLQTDFVNPLSSTLKLETGVRAAIRSRTNNNDNFVFNSATNQYVVVPAVTSNYKSTDNVYAAYASLTQSLGNFGYKLGLRAESSNYKGELTKSGDKFTNSYPVSLFPSIFLSQKLANKQEVQLSYTRRINRPNFFQLIPFVDFTDQLNITKGNPGLVPEFTNSLEMAYSKTFARNNSFLTSLYYKKTTDLITRFLDKEINPFTGTEAIINTYINASSSQSYGSELTAQLYPTKWWDFTTNVNIYNSTIAATGTTKATADNSLWSWFGKFNSNFKLPGNFTTQLSATYQAKTNSISGSGGGFGGPPGARGGGGGGGPMGGGFGQAQSASQGYIRPFYGVDIAIKKTFLKNNTASATLSVSDIFKTRKTDQYSESEYFIQNYNRLRDPQMIRLTLAYRFGKIDATLFKRKNNNTGTQTSESMQ